MIYHRTVVPGIEIPNRRGAGERRVAEEESPGPDSIGQVSQSIECYPAVGGQLASGHRDHAARPDGQKVIPSGMECRFLPPWQYAQPRERTDDTLAPQHRRAQEVAGHLQEKGDVFGLCGYSGRVTMVLLLGGAEENPVLAGHGVEVLSIVQRHGNGCPPLFIRP
jgi:hypothetical protein